jgi:hypothetical protein
MDDARERFQQAHRAFERFEHSHDPGDSSALKDRLGDLLGTLHEVERLTHLLEDSLHGEAAGPGPRTLTAWRTQPGAGRSSLARRSATRSGPSARSRLSRR